MKSGDRINIINYFDYMKVTTCLFVLKATCTTNFGLS